MAEFLNMGGYAFYVWTSYFFALILLGGVALWSSVQSRKVRLSAIRKAQQRRRKS